MTGVVVLAQLVVPPLATPSIHRVGVAARTVVTVGRSHIVTGAPMYASIWKKQLGTVTESECAPAEKVPLEKFARV